MSCIKHAHILLHDLLNCLELLFHALGILKGFRIVELPFFLFNDTIELNEIMTPFNTLKSRLEVMGSENGLGLVEERNRDCINKNIN